MVIKDGKTGPRGEREQPVWEDGVSVPASQGEGSGGGSEGGLSPLLWDVPDFNSSLTTRNVLLLFTSDVSMQN